MNFQLVEGENKNDRFQGPHDAEPHVNSNSAWDMDVFSSASPYVLRICRNFVIKRHSIPRFLPKILYIKWRIYLIT